MGDLTVQRFPWEPVPVTLEDTARAIELLKTDFAYAVNHTAVLVHSNNPALAMLVNTKRGQVIPRGESFFSDGSRVEFQDIGMCQPGRPEMSVQDLIKKVVDTARELGLELKP